MSVEGARTNAHARAGLIQQPWRGSRGHDLHMVLDHMCNTVTLWGPHQAWYRTCVDILSLFIANAHTASRRVTRFSFFVVPQGPTAKRFDSHCSFSVVSNGPWRPSSTNPDCSHTTGCRQLCSVTVTQVYNFTRKQIIRKMSFHIYHPALGG